METCFIHIDDNGELKNPAALEKALRLKPGRYKVEIKRAGKRSLQVNKYYWACIVDLEQQGFKEIGYDYSKEQVHEFNKAEFNYEEIVSQHTGEVKRVPLSSTDLTNTQFSEFIERIRIFCAEWLNVNIPEANSQRAIDYTT